MSTTDPKITGIYAGALSLVEIGLGSLLHGLKIPLAGTFLSLNQILFLTRITRLNRNQADVASLPLRVSNITALLKSLSPAGKKLLPMLAISAQGLFFSFGLFALGPNLFGCVLGGTLASAWGVLQPVAILWLIYGFSWTSEEITTLLDAFNRLMRGVVDLTPDSLVLIIGLFLCVKALTAMGLAVLGWRAAFDEQAFMNQQLLKLGAKGLRSSSTEQNKNTTSPAWGALRELTRPLFFIPLIFTGVVFWFSEHDKAQWVWIMLRPIAIAYLFFLILRIIPLDRWIKKTGWGGPALANALDFIEGRKREP
ncbi:hypothetical protein EBR78_00370 [bacterium]|nr:hypothetical protein [bacterium]